MGGKYKVQGGPKDLETKGIVGRCVATSVTYYAESQVSGYSELFILLEFTRFLIKVSVM